jgi:hypothetical protein
MMAESRPRDLASAPPRTTGIAPAASDEALHAVNRELAALWGMHPAPIELGADAALRDDLVICGLLGGKEVGKSTLVDALAGTSITPARKPVGEGTSRPMAFVHEDAQAAVTRRLREIDRLMPLDIQTHRADRLRHAVLVDLPDFDSEFSAHLKVVRNVAPLLDRVLWVLTPRKIGDRAWVRMFHDVIKDSRNVRCVLNKVDELLADGEPLSGGNGRRGAEAFFDRQRGWVEASLRAAGCEKAAPDRFLVSAAFPSAEHFVRRIGHLWDDPTWQRYAGDRADVAGIADLVARDMDRLREMVLSPVSAETAVAMKSANRRFERAAAVERIRQHYDLERVSRDLDDAARPEYHRAAVLQALGEDCLAAFADAAERHVRSDAELADEILDARVREWPLLRVVYFPLGWLSRSLGRRVGPRPVAQAAIAHGGVQPVESVDRLADHPAIRQRLAQLRSRVLADHVLTVQRLRLEDDLPGVDDLSARTTERLRGLTDERESHLIAAVRGRYRRPSLIGRGFLWLTALWFPLLQPLSEGAMQLIIAGTAIETMQGLYQLLSVLSAPRILAGLGVAAALFIAIIAGMYARVLRRLTAARSHHRLHSPWGASVEAALAEAVAEPLIEPFRRRRLVLADLERRLDAAAEAPA